MVEPLKQTWYKGETNDPSLSDFDSIPSDLLGVAVVLAQDYIELVAINKGGVFFLPSVSLVSVNLTFECESIKVCMATVLEESCDLSPLYDPLQSRTELSSARSQAGDLMMMSLCIFQLQREA